MKPADRLDVCRGPLPRDDLVEESWVRREGDRAVGQILEGHDAVRVVGRIMNIMLDRCLGDFPERRVELDQGHDQL